MVSRETYTRPHMLIVASHPLRRQRHAVIGRTPKDASHVLSAMRLPALLAGEETACCFMRMHDRISILNGLPPEMNLISGGYVCFL